MNANPTPRPSRSPGWTTGLALISLVLSGLLWLSGLVDSLQRPSVGNDLELRQQELAALAAPGLPPSLGRALARPPGPWRALESQDFSEFIVSL